MSEKYENNLIFFCKKSSAIHIQQKVVKTLWNWAFANQSLRELNIFTPEAKSKINSKRLILFL